MRHRARVHARRDQPRDVRHIHKKQRANRFRSFGHPLEFDHPRIRARTCHDHLRLVLARQPLNFVVINLLVILPHSVGDELVHPTGKIQRMSVRQVPPV